MVKKINEKSIKMGIFKTYVVLQFKICFMLTRGENVLQQ